MVYSEKIQRAILCAIRAHEIDQKQKRKGKDVAYIVHPLSVGLILSRVGCTEDVVAAGILHDTIEDSLPSKKVTKEMLAEEFGDVVASIVDDVTEHDQSRPWVLRKREALAHIVHFSRNSLLVKSADVLANVADIVADFTRDGDSVFTRFMASKEKILEHYRLAIDALVDAWPKSPLASDLRLHKRKLAVIARTLGR